MVVEESSTGVNENASELQFDPEFEDIHILSNAQVAIILQASARSAVNRDEELNDVYRKTQKYVERFNTMTNPEKDHQELVDELDNLQEWVLIRMDVKSCLQQPPNLLTLSSSWSACSNFPYLSWRDAPYSFTLKEH